MKSLTSKLIFRDVFDGPGWTDEYDEYNGKSSQKNLSGEVLSNNYSFKDNKLDPKT